YDIVASFIVNKSVTVLEDNKFQLEAEILEEIEAPKVTILSLDPLPRPNNTKVVFAVNPDGENSETPSPAISLIRSLFASLEELL
ncbi:hypothetical protein A2U01_0035983, partial [Trifolium medium]|nr:hypothetical protein [Trifolium medium]